MICLSRKLETQPALTHDSINDSELKIFGFQDRSLLNVHFNERICISGHCSFFDLGGVEAKGADSIVHAHAIGVFASENLGVEIAGNSATSDEWQAVAN